MKTLAVLLLGGTFVVPALWPQELQPPQIDGYVSRVVSNSDFDVNGIQVLCGPETQSGIDQGHGSSVSDAGCPKSPFVGEPMEIFGSFTKKKKSIVAERLFTRPMHPRETSGSAVIDGLPLRSSGDTPPGVLMVRTDGYRIVIDSKTALRFSPPLKSLSDVTVGDWIDYKANEDSPGGLVATSADVAPSILKSGEEKLHAREEFDPSAVPQDARQNVLKESVSLYDPKKFPPFNSPAMQARVSEIGNKLVPAYQRNLPDSDPTKIDFRFHVIDTKLFRDAFALSNGIILIPHQVVERMQNDSQLAAVLADNIASVLERLEYRTLLAARVNTAANLSSFAFAVFPPVDIFSIGGSLAAGAILSEAQQQAERVSLTLMNDAGYDIDQAPLAWWLLAPIKPEPITKVSMPDNTAYIYRTLGEVWHNPAASALQNH